MSYEATCEGCQKLRLYKTARKTFPRLCISCSRRSVPIDSSIAVTHPHLAARFSKTSPVPATAVKRYSKRQVLIECEKGHEWSLSVHTLHEDIQCPYCINRRVEPKTNDVATTHPEFASRFSITSPVSPHEVTQGSSAIAKYKCIKCGYEWEASVKSSIKSSGQCFACSHRKVPKPESSIAKTHPEVLYSWSKNNKDAPETYSYGSNKKVLWLCKECNEDYTRSVASRISSDNPCCASCTNRRHRTSKAEKAVFSFLQELHPSFQASVRTVIAPYELDCYSQELGLAVEFNGTYWHSDEMILRTRGMKAQEYHEMKTRRCREAGIRLIHVAEEDWKTTPIEITALLRNAVKEAIADKLSSL